MKLAPTELELIEDYLDLVLKYSQPKATIDEEVPLDLWTLRTWIETLDLPLNIREKLAIADELVRGNPTLLGGLILARDAYLQGAYSDLLG